jgi:molybdate transport system substrate-binding protein
MAVSRLLAELAPACDARLGVRVDVESVGGVDAARRVAEGEVLDFVVLAGTAMSRLAQANRVDPATCVPVARAAMALAVAPGVTLPRIETALAVRDAVLAASRVAYSTGPSGQHLLELLERWAIAERMAPRLVLAPPGTSVASLLARGDAEIGFQQMSELVGVNGIAIAGQLPADIAAITLFEGAMCATSRQPSRVRDVLEFLGSAEHAALRARHGFQP